MITGSYDLDTVEEAFDVALKIDLSFKMLVNAKAWCSKCEGYGHYDYQCLLESRHVRIVPSDDVDDSKVVKDVHISFKTTSIIKDILVGSNKSIIEEGHASYESTREVVGAIVESGIPLNVDAHAHDISEYALELAEFSISSQISRFYLPHL